MWKALRIRKSNRKIHVKDLATIMTGLKNCYRFLGNNLLFSNWNFTVYIPFLIGILYPFLFYFFSISPLPEVESLFDIGFLPIFHFDTKCVTIPKSNYARFRVLITDWGLVAGPKLPTSDLPKHTLYSECLLNCEN